MECVGLGIFKVLGQSGIGFTLKTSPLTRALKSTFIHEFQTIFGKIAVHQPVAYTSEE